VCIRALPGLSVEYLADTAGGNTALPAAAGAGEGAAAEGAGGGASFFWCFGAAVVVVAFGAVVVVLAGAAVGAAVASAPHSALRKSFHLIPLGKLIIDYFGNGRGASAVGCYSPRARPSFPIGLPTSWTALERELRPNAFTLGAKRRHRASGPRLR
jgi:hypothetical protein